MQRAASQNFRETGGLIDLSARAKLALDGTDSVRYLNGQITNDLRKITVSDALYACVTSAKGKLCADVFITAVANHQLLIDADPSLREPLAARLERYIVADDVTIDDATDRLALIHIFGVETSPLANFPGARSQRFGKTSIDLFIPRPQFSEVWNSLAANFPIIGEPAQEALRIEAGIPRWNFELTDETLPAEAGLDKTAVDFHKGCYIGQEIISRIQSVGRVNRSLTGFILANRQPGDSDLDFLQQLRGAQLFANDQLVGTLTSATHSPTLDKFIALGYLKRAAAKSSSIFEIRDAANRRLGDATIHPLPFL